MKFELLSFLREQGGIEPTGRYHLSSLRGGYWNQVYRLQGKDIDWVAKLYAAERPASLFPILPEAAATTLKRLTGSDIAPDYITFYPKNAGHNPDILIYKFVPGPTWNDGTPAVARLLRRLHAVDTSAFSALRMLDTEPEQLLAAGDTLLESIQLTANAQMLRNKRPEHRKSPKLEDRRLVHADSGSGNLIAAANGPILIDWQCPGLGDPAEDLFCFLSPIFQSLFNQAPFTEAEIAAFFEAYEDEGTVARYQALQPYFCYRMAAHCCLQTERRRSSDPKGSAAFGAAFQIALSLL